MLDNHYSFFKTALCFLVINFLLFPVMGFSGVVDEKLKGDDKLSENQIEEAEKHYAKALQMDPENWKIMRSLAEVRFQLKKYKETKLLVDRILAMKVTTRKIVVVKVKGEPDSFEAEIVDESVIRPDSGKNNMRNYVDGAAKKRHSALSSL
jgi:tetratricopeptide (TPR) repeat protein